MKNIRHERYQHYQKVYSNKTFYKHTDPSFQKKSFQREQMIKVVKAGALDINKVVHINEMFMNENLKNK